MGRLEQEIRERLEAALAPLEIELIDQSEAHRGHAGWRPGGGTHFRLRLVSAAFKGRSRLERQRMVYDVLAGLMTEKIHALSMELEAPGED